MVRKKILYIEDHPASLFLVENLLEKKGYQVLGSLNGRQGIKRATEERPDLILVDMVMADMDGFEILSELQKNTELQLIPKVAISAQTLNKENEKCLRAGFNGFIKKPINVNTFENQLNSFFVY